MLAGTGNDLRAQNRCVSIWDAIINALDQARLQTQGSKADAHEDIEALNRRAASALAQNNPKDLSTALPPRQISIASHQAWAVAALRFVQTWYSRIDLIPHIEFDLTIQALMQQDIPGALSTFDRLTEIITNKISQGQTLPELRQHILSYLDTIKQVLQAWDYLNRYQRKQLTDSQLLAELSTSTLRVSDPILSELYYGIKGGDNPGKTLPDEKAPETKAAEKPDSSPAPESSPKETPVKEDKPSPTEKTSKKDKESSSGDPLIDNAIKTAQALKLEADRTDNFNMLRSTGFFQRLNDFCLNRNAFDNKEVREYLDPLLLTIVDKIDLWSQNIRPEKYFVTQEAIDSIDWIGSVSPIVYTCPVRYENREVKLDSVVKARLSEIFQSIYYALAKEQTAGEPPEIPQKIAQIKILRKRLDMENLTYIRSLIDRGEFEAANQVINLHYSESPYTFDQLNNEIAQKRKEQADQKTLAVIDAVLNDLNSNDTKLETAHYLNSPKSAAMVSDRFFSFKNRGTQLFDLQDELTRTKAAIQDQRKTIQSMRIFSIAALLAAVITAGLAAILLTSSMNKNNGLQSSMNAMATANAQYQSDNNEMLIAIAQTAAVQPDYPTAAPVVPTLIPTPTMIPTAMPEMSAEESAQIARPEEIQTEVPAQDAKVASFVGRDVTIDLSNSVLLYASSDLDTNFQLGTIIDNTAPITGQMVEYTSRAVNVLVPCNIGRSQISTANDREVSVTTNIRLYSEVPSATKPVFILQRPVQLIEPAADCTESGGQTFCHGTLSIWFDRNYVEPSMR